jgi:hypothetical protein
MSTTYVGSSHTAASPATATPGDALHRTAPRTSAVDDLVVHRREIQFHDVTRELVRIDVTVHNVGLHRSAPAPLVLETAPFGAFVRWTELATLRVPRIEPGGRAVVSTVARAPRVRARGDFDSLTPRQLLTATGGDDQERPQRGRTLLDAWRERAIGNGPAVRRLAVLQAGTPLLARDIYELVGRRTAHWAGNLNVFIGNRAVERHRARALRIYPEKTNLAMFMCGEGADAYAFHLEGSGAEWDAALFCASERRALALGRYDPIEPDAWIPASGTRVFLVGLTPPKDAVHGEVEVHVRQRSTGKEAVVEFSLDAKAQGPGCYTV